jgi:regulator of protease activity HflC (stomatin/prohibitin superfamily)
MWPFPSFVVVREKRAVIVERLGRFHRILPPGFNILTPMDRKAGEVNLQIQEMSLHIETKTADDVFVRITVAVQYRIMSSRIREAFYELSNPRMQIESYVYDEVRAHVPRMKLDDVFQNKDDIANAVKTGLEETMSQYGYDIIKSLVNDIDPDPKVKQAMNEINAAQRIRRASEDRGEAEKILRVKAAEGEAQSAVLRGEGIAGERCAIIDGLRKSVIEFRKSIPDASASDVMNIVIMAQYFDTLKEIGASSRTNTLLVPHNPGNLSGLTEQIAQSIRVSNLSTDMLSHAVQNEVPPPENIGEETDTDEPTASPEEVPASPAVSQAS